MLRSNFERKGKIFDLDERTYTFLRFLSLNFLEEANKHLQGFIWEGNQKSKYLGIWIYNEKKKARIKFWVKFYLKRIKVCLCLVQGISEMPFKNEKIAVLILQPWEIRLDRGLVP